MRARGLRLASGRQGAPASGAAWRWLLTLCFACLPALALAQQEMEIISLRHRTLEQVLPALQPLLEPGGAISGMNDQLILRASRRNREQIRLALEAIDTPVRRLLIRVSQHRDEQTRQQGVEVSAIDLRRGDSRVVVRAQDRRGAQNAGSTQMVQVVEGGRAFIRVGQSLPIPLQQLVVGPRGIVVSQGVVFRDLGQGFFAAPRVVGDRVTLEISPQFDSPADLRDGSFSTQRLSTTVSGRLGEWLALGGSSQQTDFGVDGNLPGGSSQSSIWLRVEELP